MKKLIAAVFAVLFLCLFAAACLAEDGIPIDESHFPDQRFRNYVAENRDTDADGFLSAEEIEVVETIGIYDSFVESFEGVEYFTNLQHLICYGNRSLKKLDVSKNARLEELNCYNCQLTSLKLGSKPALKTLQCSGNSLKSLDISGCTALEVLNCDENPFGKLSVRNNPSLTAISCSACGLTDLDLSGCGALQILYCGSNQLTALDTKALSNLTKLFCHSNSLVSLDLRGNPALKELSCAFNALTALDLSCCPKLTNLECAYNKLTALDLSVNTSLEELTCDGNQLTGLDVGNCRQLYHLQCNENRLSGLDVSKNTALTALYCSKNQLTALNVDKNKKLIGLDCADNQLTALSVTNNTGLHSLNCGGNQLVYVDLTRCRELGSFDCATRYPVTVTGSRLDLTQIPGFKYKKASGWTGGTAKGSVLTFTGDSAGCQVSCGKGYQISLELVPTFKKAALSSAKLAYVSKAYTGAAHEPAVTVKAKVNGKAYTLTAGEDYTVTYKNNVKAGTAAVTVKGRGHYKGTLTKKFTITPVKILKVTLSKTSYAYDGKAHKPIPTVTTKINGQLVTLKKNTDYTVKYENNVEAGTATVTVTGKGNYKGTITKTFRIE